MKEITLTCPFTGCSFKALEDADDNVYFTHPLTGDEVIVQGNTYIASVMGITMNGATPVFVEPDGEWFIFEFTPIRLYELSV